MTKLYIYALALLVAFGAGAKVSSMWAEKKLVRELAAQAEMINAECEKSKQLTERVDNEYQQKINQLRADVKRARGLHKSNNCVSVVKTASGDNATAAKDVIHGKYVIGSEWLINYAEEAEQVRVQLLGCQEYVRGLHGQ